jgi:hypothetical protein
VHVLNGISGLLVLNLSGNNIRGIECLLGLQSLRSLNVKGNPVLIEQLSSDGWSKLPNLLSLDDALVARKG